MKIERLSYRTFRNGARYMMAMIDKENQKENFKERCSEKKTDN